MFSGLELHDGELNVQKAVLPMANSDMIDFHGELMGSPLGSIRGQKRRRK